MNIEQYYEQSATASLNASLVAFIPPTLLLIYSVVITDIYQLLLLEIPFLIYSFYCYQLFLLEKKRAQSVNAASIANEQKGQSPLSESALLLLFLPAPSLRLLLFTPGGLKAGEIRDKSFFRIRWFLPFFVDKLFTRKIGFYDAQEQALAFFHFHRDRLEIVAGDGECLMTIFKVKKGKKKEYVLKEHTVMIEKKGIPADYSFLTYENRLIAEIKTGWMPVEWGERFVNPNTPIMRFHQHLTNEEKIQIMAIISTMYAYTNH